MERVMLQDHRASPSVLLKDPMNIQLAPQLARRSRLFTQIASTAVIMLGSLVLTGWQLQFEGFKSILSGLLSMAPTTAAGMFLCGTALNLLSHKETKAFRFLATALAMVVIAFGLLVLSEYFFGWDLPLDHWLSRREAVPSQLVRMAPTAALCFVLTGGAVFRASRRIRRPLKLPLVAALGAAVMVIGALALIGHVFEAVSGSRSWNYTGMAVHTAAGFLLLGSMTLGLARSRATFGWSLNATTTGGFLLGIVLMVAVAAVSYNLTRQSQRTAILVGHTQEILKEIQEVEVSMLTIETGQRGYIITGDETLLGERDALETEVHEHLDKLCELCSDNPNQRRRLDQIQPLIAERIRWGDETVLARRRSGFSAVQEKVSAGTGHA
ncbi:MAG TPA: CHASE3 domain-containing protein, partial [Chthoniobacterales bacterium]|nr:CHASE3 domain-containing protein [Chthoniobacterales bacterium]